MSKSAVGEAGSILLLGSPEVIRRKLLRAVTDSGRSVGYDPARRPGVANLLEILAACTGGTPDGLAERFSSYGELKQATADAVIELVEPLQQRYAELAAAPEQVTRILAEGAVAARKRTAGTVDRARTALGLV